MSKQTRSPRLKTDAPKVSDATIARIRAAAHRYVLAGGSIFPTDVDDRSRGEHIATVREVLEPGLADELEDLLKTHLPDYKTHEAVWFAVWNLVGAADDAGFMFGALVGLDVAALTFGQLSTIPAIRARRARKAGRR